MINREKFEKIKRLKEEKDAVILAHYYVDDDVQEIADYVGDSFYLAKVATGIDKKVILFCGVMFMGESAKILNPDKTVLLPDATADCPMAHMAQVEKIKELRAKYDDLAVVCYVNSTAELKMHSDVCVTSSNALEIVKALPNKNIFFIPDQNLGGYIKDKVTDKNIILNDGYCHVHKELTKESVLAAKAAHPDALFLVHPECRKEIVDLADYAGSTAGIIDFATNSEEREFIIGTELGVMFELKSKNPYKQFYPANEMQICPNMKKITLDKVISSLENMEHEVTLTDEVIDKANAPLKRMLEFKG
ncbi:MAG: quinolinate synthase NadA [Lachnospiraceae bacterium]|nr:quinolinate synthase NadA [Lachnospiraceae bacterium]